MKQLSFKQLRKIILENEYIIVTDYHYDKYGINCKVQKYIAKDRFYRNGTSSVISWRPCTLNEYINFKGINHFFYKKNGGEK